MKEPSSLAVRTMHEMLLSWFGGTGGVRSERALKSILTRPGRRRKRALHDAAAEYAFGIVKNHPFLDGNKRAGFMAAAWFLELNGFRFTALEEEVVLQTRALAAGEIGKKEYAHWLKASCG